MIDCTVRVGTFCKTPQLSYLRKITLTEQFFPFSLIIFTIWQKKFITNFVTAVTNFLTHVTNFVIRVTKFVTKTFLKKGKNISGKVRNKKGQKKRACRERPDTHAVLPK